MCRQVSRKSSPRGRLRVTLATLSLAPPFPTDAVDEADRNRQELRVDRLARGSQVVPDAGGRGGQVRRLPLQ